MRKSEGEKKFSRYAEEILRITYLEYKRARNDIYNPRESTDRKLMSLVIKKKVRKI